MTEATASSNTGEQQKHTAAFFGAVLNSGAEPVLRAQADLLASVETSVTAWLRRRHEAVADTLESTLRHDLERLGGWRKSPDARLGDVLKNRTIQRPSPYSKTNDEDV